MAVVFLGREHATRRSVAIKMLRADRLRDAESLARFEREARLAVALQHPAIVQTIGVFRTRSGGLAIVQEYLSGGSLRTNAPRPGRIAVEHAHSMLAQLTGALMAAHAKGVIHRDIKPDNILIDGQTGAVKLGDFGIARIEGTDTLSLTRSGVGTPRYMAPEQLQDARGDERSDLYSLGLVTWELLSGRQPYAGDDSLSSLVHRQINEPLPDLGALRPDVPPWLLAVVRRLTAKDRRARFGSAHELAAAIGLTQASGQPASGAPAAGQPSPTPQLVPQQTPPDALPPAAASDPSAWIWRTAAAAVGALALFWLVQVMPSQRRFSSTRERAYIASMKSDLRNLVTAQEAFFSDNNSVYATSIEAMGTNYRASSGVQVSIDGVSGTGWVAHATHSLLPGAICAISVGGTATTEGEPVCGDASRMYNWINGAR